jgi:uncharacterized protein
MRALVKLFGRSPFAPLRNHMERVKKCVEKLPELFEAVKAGDGARVEEVAKQISQLEHEADLAKNDIRNSLKSSLLLPVGRAGLLDVLSLQDAIADRVEDIGVILTFRKPELPKVLEGLFDEFLQKNLEAYEAAAEIIGEIQEILETSFGGTEAKKVRAMVDQVAYKEHKVDVLQRELLKGMFNSEDSLSYAAFHLWMRVIEEVGDLSNLSEKLANRLLMTMEVK